MTGAAHHTTGLTPIGSEVRRLVLTLAEAYAEDRARELLVFADGIAELYPELASRSRLVATDLLETLQALVDERHARQAIQTDRDRILKLNFPGAA